MKPTVLQERCIAAVERANGAEARESALAEEKAQLKAGMKVAFTRQEELEESLAAATADAADLRQRVGRAPPLWMLSIEGLLGIRQASPRYNSRSGRLRSSCDQRSACKCGRGMRACCCMPVQPAAHLQPSSSCLDSNLLM
jgi:hypothetical protein